MPQLNLTLNTVLSDNRKYLILQQWIDVISWCRIKLNPLCTHQYHRCKLPSEKKNPKPNWKIIWKRLSSLLNHYIMSSVGGTGVFYKSCLSDLLSLDAETDTFIVFIVLCWPLWTKGSNCALSLLSTEPWAAFSFFFSYSNPV